MIPTLLDILTVLCLIVGLAFMFIGALGLLRLPDIYHRMHAASKCITLGIAGLLLAAIFRFASAASEPETAESPGIDDGVVVAAITKAVLVIAFQFISAPVGSHMLSRAAHLDGSAKWEGTLSDEMEEDRKAKATDQAAGAG